MNEDGRQRRIWPIFAFMGFLALVLFISMAIVLGDDGGYVEDDSVALVRVEDVIIDAEKVISQLRDWTENESVKAIVLRVNSPGGAVAPSQEIYSEVVKAARKKPVVASMGAVAASGGYYVSAPCKVIVANPGTVTGSIGVIMNLSNIEKLLEKIGLAPVVIKSGKNKDIGSPYRPMTDEERALLQSVADDIHEQFIEHVAEARKMDIEEIRSLADGRIFTGREAVGLKLVDKLGTMQDAIDEAAKLAGLEADPNVVEKKERKGLLRWVLESKNPISLPAGARLTSGFYYLWPAW